MRTHRTVRSAAVLAALVVMLVAFAASAAGAGVGPRDRSDRDRRIGVGDANIVAGEMIDGPLVTIDGRSTVAGTVDGEAIVVRGDLVVKRGGEIDGDVLVARGDARIDGTVDGDVVVLGGTAIVNGGAVVDGDVLSTRNPRVAGSARVSGDVEHIDIPGMIAALGAGLLLFWWIAVTVSTAILGALVLWLFPRGMEAGAAAGRSRSHWWVSVLVGLGIVIGLPIIGVVAVSSLVGLPLGFGVLGALGVVHATGYVAGAFFLGRCILKTPKDRFGAFFVGWAILRVLAILPLLGMLVWVAAAVYGIGTLAVAGFRAGRLPRSTDDPHAPTVPPPLSAPDAAPGAPTPAAVATAPASDVEAPPATDPGSESGSPE